MRVTLVVSLTNVTELFFWTPHLHPSFTDCIISWPRGLGALWLIWKVGTLLLLVNKVLILQCPSKTFHHVDHQIFIKFSSTSLSKSKSNNPSPLLTVNHIRSLSQSPSSNFNNRVAFYKVIITGDSSSLRKIDKKSASDLGLPPCLLT